MRSATHITPISAENANGGQTGYGGAGGYGDSYTGGAGGSVGQQGSNGQNPPYGGTGGSAGTGTGGAGANGGSKYAAYNGGGGGGGGGADGFHSTGGAGGNGGKGYGYDAGGGGGGAGGRGLYRTPDYAYYVNNATIKGGVGGSGGAGGFFSGHVANQDHGRGGGGGGGGGGNGIELTGSHTSVKNYGLIAGGNGGAGGSGSLAAFSGYYVGGSGGNGGNGGFGIYAKQLFTITNYSAGVIRGGSGGAGGAGYGVGTKGSAGAFGAGIAGESLTIVNGGTISGGADSDGVVHADAIDFTGGTNTLTLSYDGTTGVIDGAIGIGGTLNIDPGTAAGVSVTLSSNLKNLPAFDGGRIDKVGAGTLILTGHNTYAHGTTVDAGVLKIVGAVNGDGEVVISDGAKFILDSSSVTAGVRIVIEPMSSAAHATLSGGHGNDTFTFIGKYSVDDLVNGNGGNDTLVLYGDYSTGLSLGSGDLKNVETIKLTSGSSYKLTTADSLLTGSQSIFIIGTALGGSEVLTFNGSAEKTGGFVVHGGGGSDSILTGGGNDIITGGLGADTISAGNGTNTINGGAGADNMTGGSGVDTYVYAAASDSTSTGYDTINGFDFSHDKFNVAGTITKIDTAVSHGVSTAKFDTYIADAAAHLDAHGAMLITASHGTLSGDVFLVIDQNGQAGYQHGHDLVIELHGTTGTLTTADFI